MPKRLTESQVERMARDGFLAPIPVFSADRARGYRRALERYEASVADRPKEEVTFTLSRFKPHLLFTWLDEICHEPALLDAIEDLIGPDILVFSTAFFTKNARDSAYVPWHQDNVYADFEGGRQVRAWVAFTDSHPGNGCMRAIPGTHRQRLRHIEQHDDADNILFRKESVAEAVDEARAVDLVLQPGEMSIHDYGVVHGSNPNTSGDRRIGFAIACVSPDTLPRGRRETGMLVRGREPTGRWDLEPRPKADLDAAARAAHAKAMQQRAAHFFRETPEVARAS
jgi:non-heme Fe2+,alpha-ketoglutarate-dependent halogenase